MKGIFPRCVHDNFIKIVSSLYPQGAWLDVQRELSQYFSSEGVNNQIQVKRGIPNYSYKPNTITFPTANKLAKTSADNVVTEIIEYSFSAFKGEGNILKENKQ